MSKFFSAAKALCSMEKPNKAAQFTSENLSLGRQLGNPGRETGRALCSRSLRRSAHTGRQEKRPPGVQPPAISLPTQPRPGRTATACRPRWAPSVLVEALEPQSC